MRLPLSSRFTHTPSALRHAQADGIRLDALRCSICTQRIRSDIVYLDETGNVPEPRQSWVLCPTCDAAVRAELERSPVQGPLRLRIAVGLVAAERSPHALHAPRAGLRDDAWLSLLFWVFGIAMVLHLFVIVWIASTIH
jgi:hypothetical protein